MMKVFSRFRTIVCAAMGAVLSGIPFPALAEDRSAYTTLDFDRDCVAISASELGGTWSCTGYKGYGILFSEGDLRTSLHFGHVGPWFNADGQTAWESFGPFNSVHQTTEWRLTAEGHPFAAIHRFFVDQDGGDPRNILVVFKVGQPGESQTCMTGMVDASLNADANVKAREIADDVTPDFDCAADEPVYVGATDQATPEPVRYRPTPEQ